MLTLLLSLSLAQAGDVDGQLFGQPFTPKSAVGLTDPAHPGTLSVLLTSEPMTCEDAKAMQAGTAKPAKKPEVLVMTAFTDPVQGSALAQWMIVGSGGLGALVGTATLSELPAAVGQRGTVTFALDAQEKVEGLGAAMVASAPGDHLHGDVGFELCDAITARPSLAGTVFTSQQVHIEEKSYFPDTPSSALDVTLALPEGWTAGADPSGSPQWTAPDGQTRLVLSLSTPFDPFESGAREWLDMQVKAFQTEATSAEMVTAALAGDGAYAAHWRYRWGSGPWTHELVVFRHEAGWAHTVGCRVTADETAAAQVFDGAQKACVGLTAAP